MAEKNIIKGCPLYMYIASTYRQNISSQVCKCDLANLMTIQ